MSVLDKAYYTLEEVESRWHLPHRDVVYLAENGLLRLSVRLYGVQLERGLLEAASDGRPWTVPTDQAWFTGLQDLLEADAHRLFRDGQVVVREFDAPDHEYIHLREPTEEILVRVPDVVVRKEERDRVEATFSLNGAASGETPRLQQSNGYAEVRLDGRTYHLGTLQARVVERLHQAALAGNPWCAGKAVLGEVGSASTRMADVFKSQRDWRRLIESDRRGRYRLNLPPR